MRIANLAGRLVVVVDDHAVDVETVSQGRFSSDPQDVYPRWKEFQAWVAEAELGDGIPFDPENLGAPAPAPRQLFAVGLNYREHVAETGFATPAEVPSVFTKFSTCLTGPITEVRLPAGGHTDWEVELVVVIGRWAHQVKESDAWDHVAGLTVGQDLSERVTQLSGQPAQFSLGKSFPGFGPTGPALVTPNEFDDPDDLQLTTHLNGEEVQRGSTRQMIYSVPALIARLSEVLPLLPGDVIFTGTPAGVGLGRSPQRWLAPGDRLVSRIAGVGELRQHFSD